MNIFTKHWLIILMALTFQSINLVKASQSDVIQAFKIEFSDKQLAGKVAISFHHAILETNYEQGYLIANLTNDEINDLKKYDLVIKPAIEWQQKYQQFQANIQSIIQSQQKSSTKLAGIPGYSCYSTVEETFQQAIDLVANYPDLAEWIDIGDSWQKTNNLGGYDLMVLKITNKNITGDKPKLLINSGLHAREYAPVALSLDFAHKLLEEYATNADMHWIVDHHEIHLLLQTNPDGRKVAEQGIYQRKNMNSNHCPGEISNNQYVGVDLNRNFAHFWNSTSNGSSGDACSEVYRGATAESELETQALSNYVRALFADKRGPNLNDPAAEDTKGIHLDIHSYSQLVLWPYGHTFGASPNDQSFVALGNKFAWYNNYTPQQSIGLYPTDGTSDDVSYGELGVAAFTFEVGTSFFQVCSDYQNTIKPGNIKALVYAAKASAAPYQLAFGPEMTQVDLNGTLGTVTIAPSTPITIKATASLAQTKQNISNRNISRIEYSIDQPLWEETTLAVELTDNDGSLTSATETIQGVISTDSLTLGQHILYVRGFDETNRVGVTSARFINISESVNALPTATILSQCTYLDCSFDASTSADPDGSIIGYAWTIVDGNNTYIAEGATFPHTFTTPGDKQVNLNVTDNLGAQSSSDVVLTVTAKPIEPTQTSSSGGGSLFWLNSFSLLFLLRRVN